MRFPRSHSGLGTAASGSDVSDGAAASDHSLAAEWVKNRVAGEQVAILLKDVSSTARLGPDSDEEDEIAPRGLKVHDPASARS